ncbi:hypothetical protein [Leifsonia sp. 1010]|uniref:hypothetical protein n=1 Tax=Leifsonia sp. 1010 TaxID=2817769 RepID=UPI002862B20D|nr:hypothetical protein [Leifsonia sp. 1010]MDR6611471.1 hypothetical protein [Leifsonia sp. 1010]
MTSASPDGASRADETVRDTPPDAVAWADALDRMEQELHGALAQVDPVPWRPPIALGPIPPELQERATRLLEAQLHTIRYLEDVRQTTARHLAAVRAVPRSEVGAHPVYFDLIG